MAQALRDQPCADAEEEQALLSELLAAHEAGDTGGDSGVDTAPAPSAGPTPTADRPALTPRVRSLDPADQIGEGERVSMPAGAGVYLGFTPSHQRIELTGPGVDTALMADLKAWLRQRGR